MQLSQYIINIIVIFYLTIFNIKNSYLCQKKIDKKMPKIRLKNSLFIINTDNRGKSDTLPLTFAKKCATLFCWLKKTKQVN